MVNGFDGLRHHSVVSSDNYYCNICYLGSAGTHGCKSLMTGSVEECYLAAVIETDCISPDMLGNASGFTCNYVCAPYIVEQFCLAMVNMSHYSYDRRSWLKVSFFIFLFFDSLLELSAHKFNFKAEFICQKSHCLGIKPLVNGNKKTEIHTCRDNLCYRDVHHYRQFVGRDEFSDLEDVLVLFDLILHFTVLLADGIPFLPPVS